VSAIVAESGGTPEKYDRISRKLGNQIDIGMKGSICSTENLRLNEQGKVDLDCHSHSHQSAEMDEWEG
jgi:hypothetical protein